VHVDDYFVVTSYSLVGCAQQIKGFVERFSSKEDSPADSTETPVRAIKRRMREALDGRPYTWLLEQPAMRVLMEGVAEGSFYENVLRYLKDSDTNAPPAQFIPPFCEATGYSVEWIMTEKGTRKPTPVDEAVRKLELIRDILDAHVPKPGTEADRAKQSAASALASSSSRAPKEQKRKDAGRSAGGGSSA
jgi:hypothetical protein